MVNYKRKEAPVVQGKRTRPLQTVPDQSMTIPQILDRFTRNLPVGGKTNKPVYVDQTSFDLEALGRMDFHEKAEFAAEMAARAKEIQLALDAEAARKKKADEDELAKRLEKRAEAFKAAQQKQNKPDKDGLEP